MPITDREYVPLDGNILGWMNTPIEPATFSVAELRSGCLTRPRACLLQEQGNAVEPFLMESPLADAMRSGVAM